MTTSFNRDQARERLIDYLRRAHANQLTPEEQEENRRLLAEQGPPPEGSEILVGYRRLGRPKPESETKPDPADAHSKESPSSD